MLDQTENHDKIMILKTNENNASEYTIPESTTSAQNTSQPETSATNQFVRISTRIVSPRQNTHNPQSSSDTSPNQYRIFTIPPGPDEEVIQDTTQIITNNRDTSVNVLSPTRTIPNNIRKKTRPTYDPPSVSSVLKQPTKTFRSENNHNNKQQTSSQLYDPFSYSFFPPSNTNTQSNNTQHITQSNDVNSTTRHNIHMHICYIQILLQIIFPTNSKNILFKHCTTFSQKISKSSNFTDIY